MVSHPEHIEKIFQKVEEESVRRAMAEHEGDSEEAPSTPVSISPSTSSVPHQRRRGGSISVSRFGQPVEQVTESSSSSIVNAARLSRIASKSNFYQSRLNANSKDSFASQGSAASHEKHEEESEDRITRMQTINGRQTLTKAVGDMLSRTISRSRSNSRSLALPSDTTVVIGVSVEQATVEAEHHAEQEASTATAYALRNQQSTISLRNGREGWVQKVTQKFRRNSKSPSFLEESPPKSPR